MIFETDMDWSLDGEHQRTGTDVTIENIKTAATIIKSHSGHFFCWVRGLSFVCWGIERRSNITIEDNALFTITYYFPKIDKTFQGIVKSE